MCLGEVFILVCIWDLLNFINLIICIPPTIWKFYLKINPFVSSPSVTPNMYLLVFLDVTRLFITIFLFLSFFPPLTGQLQMMSLSIHIFLLLFDFCWWSSLNFFILFIVLFGCRISLLFLFKYFCFQSSYIHVLCSWVHWVVYILLYSLIFFKQLFWILCEAVCSFRFCGVSYLKIILFIAGVLLPWFSIL